MRVLHVTPALDPQVGGPANVATGLCRALLRAGIEATLYTTNFSYQDNTDVPLDVETDHQGVPTRFYPLTTPRRYLASMPLWRALQRDAHRFDLMHVHGLWLFPTAAACVTARRRGIPYIVRPRANLEPYAVRQRAVRKRLYAALIEQANLDGAKAVHFANESEREGAQQFGFRAPSLVLPTGVDALSDAAITRLRGTFRSRYPELQDKQIVLFLGRISAIKGLDRLIPAFRTVLERHPNARLVLAGPQNEDYAVELRRRIAAEGLTAAVVFTGHLSGDLKYAALIDADLFCLCSYQEGQSSALTEAVMCGCASVITPEVKFFELDAAGAVARVPGEPGAIADAISVLLMDSEGRKRMGSAARRFILDNYTWDRVGAQLADFYATIQTKNVKGMYA